MVNNSRDKRTQAIVLRRTNYGEADRILQLLTPEGKKSVIAKGVRKEKSKLAGGIELFSVSDVVIHEGNSGLGILTSARLAEHYDALVSDLDLIERAGVMLKEVNQRAEQVDSPEFFDILHQALRAMQAHHAEDWCWRDVLRAWWSLNLARIAGEEVNLRFDNNGEKLLADEHYRWDQDSVALAKHPNGQIGVDHIKLMRVMITTPIEVTLKVQKINTLIDEVLYIAKCIERARG
ncbi:DNA repair protein RecO [Candidatus Saccharibacteria bacterium]|nr:DNA repair protein RecO [Candidatus Saccharibacteria bacterium]